MSIGEDDIPVTELGRSRWGWRASLAVGLAAAALLVPQGGAVADPQPTIPQAKARLKKLEDRADQAVDKYNAANEKWKQAKKKYEKLNAGFKNEEKRAEQLRAGLVDVAVTSYQGGSGLEGWPFLVAQEDPSGLLTGLTTLNWLAEERAATLADYEASIKEMRRKRDEAKAAYGEATKTRDELRKEKQKVERLVREQERLLRRLGTYKTGNPAGSGAVYTGPASGSARVALQFAYAQIGKPYRYGGEGPGSWDCSGLTQAAWRAAGVTLPRTAAAQWAWGASRRVPLDQLQPGDLIFSYGLGHVGMYAGNGQMVHAPRTGDVVKLTSLASYGRGRLIGAVRP